MTVLVVTKLQRLVLYSIFRLAFTVGMTIEIVRQERSNTWKRVTANKALEQLWVKPTYRN